MNTLLRLSVASQRALSALSMPAAGATMAPSTMNWAALRGATRAVVATKPAEGATGSAMLKESGETSLAEVIKPPSARASKDSPHDGAAVKSFYRRPLPSLLVAFSSSEGRQLFKDALRSEYMNSYFVLAEQYSTQSEPAFCGPGTLAMVLNALSLDPNRVWKGPWRWFSEELLECCIPLELVRKHGLSFSQFACLARCNGANVTALRSDDPDATIERFREDIRRATSSIDEHLVAHFARGHLGQTGDGHFSPIAGYHEEEDLVLVMDVARFKYPPYWVSVERLWEAMKAPDSVNGACRGYFMLKGNTNGSRCTSLCSVAVQEVRWRDLIKQFCQGMSGFETPRPVETVHDFFITIFKNIPHNVVDSVVVFAGHLAVLEGGDKTTSGHESGQVVNGVNMDHLHAVLTAIRQTDVYKTVSFVLNEENTALSTPANRTWNANPLVAEICTLMFLGCPASSVYHNLPENLLLHISELRTVEQMPPLVSTEVSRMRERLRLLSSTLDCCN